MTYRDIMIERDKFQHGGQGNKLWMNWIKMDYFSGIKYYYYYILCRFGICSGNNTANSRYCVEMFVVHEFKIVWEIFSRER